MTPKSKGTDFVDINQGKLLVGEFVEIEYRKQQSHIVVPKWLKILFIVL